MDPRSDQYSLGVVAYEMLTGQMPFKADSTAALIHHVAFDPAPPLRSSRPDLSEEAERVLARVLAKEPTARYQTCKDFVSALEQAGLAPSTGARPSPARPMPEARRTGARSASPVRRTPPPAAPRERRGKKAPIPTWAWIAGAGGLALVGLVVVIGIVAVALSSGSASPEPSTDATATTRPVAIDEQAATPTPETAPTASPASTATPVATSAAVEEPPTDVPPPTAIPTEKPTPEPTATASPETDRAAITGIQLDGSQYAVAFEVYNFGPVLPGQHLHFFFDTVPPEQAGVPGGGLWKIYPAAAGGTALSPYTGYGVGERPSGATQMCILVANPNHSVQPGTGNCYDLP